MSDPAAVVTLRHVVPTVGPSAPAPLREAHEAVLDSIERAIDVARGRVAVEVVLARFPDEPAPVRPSFRDAPVLVSSSVDVVGPAVPRRLPLLRETLDAFRAPGAFDAFVLTNADIGLQPEFYDVVAEILADGHDAFTINRRTVTARSDGATSALARARIGTSHPGHDCFVLRPELLDGLDVGDVLLGTQYVSHTLLEALADRARRFRVFGDLHATFHVGDDRPWRLPAHDDLTRFNRRESEQARERRASSRPEGTTSVRAVAGRRHPAREGLRLVFCAASARSGTGFLARLLAVAPTVDSGHERAPTMSGPWLRDIGERGLAATRSHRRAKADAIAVELERSSPNGVYVDTSHLFLTAFHDVVLDGFDHSRIRIVALRRDPVDVARSMHLLGWFSELNSVWPDWLLDPSREASGLGIASEELPGPLDRILAHLGEVLAVRERLRAATPTITWIDADLPTLTTRTGANALLAAVGLTARVGRWGPQRRRVNARTGHKVRDPSMVTRGRIADDVDAFLERFRDRPALSALRAERERWR